MAFRYSDLDIVRMVRETKPLPDNFSSRMRLRNKRGHKERELNVDGGQGTTYRIILRQSNFNALDFSIILAIIPANSNQLFRLRRYNGKSHEHTNAIEGDKFYDFHIHKATERYQHLGGREDAFAEPTDRYADFHSALRCLLEDCNFELPDGLQATFIRELNL